MVADSPLDCLSLSPKMCFCACVAVVRATDNMAASTAGLISASYALSLLNNPVLRLTLRA